MRGSKRQSSWPAWVVGGSVLVVLAGTLVLGLAGHLGRSTDDRGSGPDHASEVSLPPVRFTDVTAAAGIDFTHTNGAYGKKLLPETMGSGVAVLDFDSDGWPDLLFINSCPWPGHDTAGPQPTSRLCRNRRDGTFEDVTAGSGLDVVMYGMGVTVGDYDNDGWPDVFIAAVGGCRLFHNERNRHPGRKGAGPLFKDVTADAHVGGPGGWPQGKVRDFSQWDQPISFPSSATFLDYDGDGRLDLFVCSYVTWSPRADVEHGFHLATGEPAYGPPTYFDGAQCLLYRNQGNGTFADVSARCGVQVFAEGKTPRGKNVGKSLAVMACDLDTDGWPDLVVANDTTRNFLFHNVAAGDGTRKFKEVGLSAGIAYTQGETRGAMGVDWSPAYRDDRGAVVIGNFAGEANSFLRLEDPRRLLLVDAARTEGIAGPSRDLLKFGVFFFDYDLDGRPDLLTCDGHLEPLIHRALPGQHYRQPVQLFWNTGRSSPGFELVTAEAAGPDLFEPLVGRGCAYLDYDADGDLDVVLTANGGPARLLRNEGGTGHHWLRLRLEGDGQRSSRSAFGARVTLESGGTIQRGELVAARGYLSQSEPVLTFGLGSQTQIDRLTIHWPGRRGGTQVLTGTALAVDQEKGIRQR